MPHLSNGPIKIYYEVRGDPTHPPLVLLHWFMGSHRTWIDINWVRTLKPHFYLLLVDLRGYGQSSKPHEPAAYHPKNHVADLELLLDHHNINQAHFMGYSMGARIGYALAASAPHVVRSLVVGGMHPFVPIPTDLEERIRLLEHGMPALLDAYNIAPHSIYQRMLKNDPKALLADTLQTKNWPDLGQNLTSFDRPVLVYVGDQDEFYEGAKKAASQLTRATFVAFPSETHRTAFTKKTLLLPHLRRFFNKQL